MSSLVAPGPAWSGAPPAEASRQDFRDRWAAVLILLTWVWSVLPRLIQTLTAPKFRASVGEAAAPNSRLAGLALLGLTLLLIAVCVLVILILLRDPHPGHLPGFFWLMSPWVYLVVRDLFVGDRPGPTTLVYPLLVTAIWLLRPSYHVLVYLGYLVALSAALGVLLGVLLPGKGIFRTAAGTVALADKAILPWGVLSGFLSHGNTLGVFLALGLPAVAMIPRRGPRRVLLGLVVFALVWAASRTALAAVALGAVTALILVAIPARRRFAWAVLAALVPFTVVVCLPLLVRDQGAFSSRGFIWAYGRLWWESSPWFGLGTGWFNAVGQTSERIASTAFHAHNQFLQFAVTGGLVMVALVAGLLITAAVRAAHFATDGEILATVYLAVLAGTCLMEKPFAFVDNYSMTPVVVLPLAVLMFADRVDAKHRAV